MPQRGKPNGLTMAELAVTSAVMGVVLVSAMHAVNVSRQSTEGVYEELAPQFEALRAAAQMRDELITATAIVAADATSIQFAVPDEPDQGGPPDIQ